MGDIITTIALIVEDVLFMDAKFLTSDEDKNVAFLIHGGVLAATIFSGGTLGLIVALITFFIYKNNNEFLRRVSSDALNVQLSGMIYAVVLFVAALTAGLTSLSGSNTAIILTIVFIALFLILAVYFFTAHIVCAFKAKRGVAYTPPLTLRLIK